MTTYMAAVVARGGNVFAGHSAVAVQADSLVSDNHRSHAEVDLAAVNLTRADAEPIAQKMDANFGHSPSTADLGGCAQRGNGSSDRSRPVTHF